LITVENLTKRYATKTAIQGVAFEVNQGEILGFLGPNGAGKTTTMRIITGYMPASDGSVRVDGFDVFEKPLDVRRRIGYLPMRGHLTEKQLFLPRVKLIRCGGQ